jgi:hypothetical protein
MAKTAFLRNSSNSASCNMSSFVAFLTGVIIVFLTSHVDHHQQSISVVSAEKVELVTPTTISTNSAEEFHDLSPDVIEVFDGYKVGVLFQNSNIYGIEEEDEMEEDDFYYFLRHGHRRTQQSSSSTSV